MPPILYVGTRKSCTSNAVTGDVIELNAAPISESSVVLVGSAGENGGRLDKILGRKCAPALYVKAYIPVAVAV